MTATAHRRNRSLGSHMLPTTYFLTAFLLLITLVLSASGCGGEVSEATLTGKRDANLRIVGEAQLTRGARLMEQSLIAMKNGFVLGQYYVGSDRQPNKGKIWVVNLAGSAKMLVDDTIPWGYIPSTAMVAVSPDESSAAFIVMEGQDNFIDKVDLKTGARDRLLQGIGRDLTTLVSWTADGRILFKRDFYLWQMNANGSNAKQLAAERLMRVEGDAMLEGNPSPDGEYIAYSVGIMPPVGVGEKATAPLTVTCRLQSVSDGTRVDIDGPLVSLVSPETSWSPDGHKLLITRIRPPVINVVAVDLMDGTETVLLDDLMKLGPGRISWAWSPDGNLLALAPYSGSKKGGLYLLDVDGQGSLTALGDAEKEYRSLQWLPDGSGILFVREGDIWIALLDSAGKPSSKAESRLKQLQAKPWPIDLQQ